MAETARILKEKKGGGKEILFSISEWGDIGGERNIEKR